MKKERAKNRHFSKNIEENIDSESISSEFEDSQVGIIAGVYGEAFTVMENDIYYSCIIHPTAHHLKQHLVIGDKVFYNNVEGGIGYILGRQERKSAITRMRFDSTRYSNAAIEQHTIAANVDVAVIVSSSHNPEFHPRFIDRYLVILQNGDVKPIICINKCDLMDKPHPILPFYQELGIPIIETSVISKRGIDLLKSFIYGQVSVLVGHSGVGKSSLVNALIANSKLRVNEVNKKTGKGKHTTSTSNLYKWDEKSYIIDTPGVRSLGIENIEKINIRHFFPEFEKFAVTCKYKNCTHDHEPDCAVKLAVEAGEINVYRYDSYIRMLRE